MTGKKLQLFVMIARDKRLDRCSCFVFHCEAGDAQKVCAWSVYVCPVCGISVFLAVTPGYLIVHMRVSVCRFGYQCITHCVHV